MSVLFAFDLLGVFAFALSGAWLATRKEFDLVGTVSLAFVTGLAGGMARDVLVGDLPPVAVVDQIYLLVPVLAAAVVLAAREWSDGSSFPVLVLDTIRLGLFASVGAAKAVEAGLGLWASMLVGVISAVGGGILRDLLAGVVPQVFGRRSELYVIPATLGALAVSAFWVRTGGSGLLTIVAVVITVILRLASVRYGWHASIPGRRTGRTTPD